MRTYKLESCPHCGAMENDPTGCHYCEISGEHLETVTAYDSRDVDPLVKALEEIEVSAKAHNALVAFRGEESSNG